MDMTNSSSPKKKCSRSFRNILKKPKTSEMLIAELSDLLFDVFFFAIFYQYFYFPCKSN